MIEKFDVIDPIVRWYGTKFYQLKEFDVHNTANDNYLDYYSEVREPANDNRQCENPCIISEKYQAE